MFYNKQRRIDELEARCAVLRRKLDSARGIDDTPTPVQGTQDWEGIAQQIAKDRVTAERAAARDLAHQRDVTEGWIAIAKKDKRSAERLAAAVVRYWTEIGQLRRQIAAQTPAWQGAEVRSLKEQVAKQDRELRTLQAANEAHYRDLQADPPHGARQQLKAAS